MNWIPLVLLAVAAFLFLVEAFVPNPARPRPVVFSQLGLACLAVGIMLAFIIHADLITIT